MRPRFARCPRRRVTPYSATTGASEASGGRRQPTGASEASGGRRQQTGASEASGGRRQPTGASEASGGRRQPIPMRPDKRSRACYRYGGVGASPALPLLPDTHGIASSRRLGSVGHPPQVGPALVTRPARVLQRPPRECSPLGARGGAPCLPGFRAESRGTRSAWAPGTQLGLPRGSGTTR